MSLQFAGKADTDLKGSILQSTRSPTPGVEGFRVSSSGCRVLLRYAHTAEKPA